MNIRLVSLAGGLALTTAALVGGSQILWDSGHSTNASTANVVRPDVAPFVDPTDFGSQGVEYTLQQQAGRLVAAASLANSLGLGQSEMAAMVAPPVDPTDFGSMAATSIVNLRFGTPADAVYAANPQVSRNDGYIGQLVNGAYVIESGADLR